jgi:hypothetical protein
MPICLDVQLPREQMLPGVFIAVQPQVCQTIVNGAGQT